MPPTPLDILVAPGTSPLGREVCRLGRAAGHEMTSLGVDGRPSSDAPWLHGVAWSTGDPTASEELQRAVDGQSGLILLPSGDREGRPAVAGGDLDDLIAAAGNAGLERIVYATVGDAGEAGEPTADERRIVEAGDLARGGVAVRLPAVESEAPVVERSADDADASGCPPIPVGQAAMALLRAAAEDERTGLIGCGAATKLGHAVMIQG